MTVRRLFALLAVLGLVAAGLQQRSGGGRIRRGRATSRPRRPSLGGGGAGDFGDLTGVCGPNEGGGEVGGDPAETQGVTADSITVGTVADPGFEGRPGLNQEIFDAGNAFVEWCNAAGGINGKEIEAEPARRRDHRVPAGLEESCHEDFAIVGSGAVQDNFWPDTGAEPAA